VTGEPLPVPVTATDFYLAAIVDRLEKVIDRLPAAAESGPPSGEVELREPAAVQPKAAGGRVGRGPGAQATKRPARTAKPATGARPKRQREVDGDG
jgi:hypothetical protein